MGFRNLLLVKEFSGGSKEAPLMDQNFFYLCFSENLKKYRVGVSYSRIHPLYECIATYFVNVKSLKLYKTNIGFKIEAIVWQN